MRRVQQGLTLFTWSPEAVAANFFHERSQQRLLSQLATSDNELASGLGQCLEALRLISALPRASPVFVEYTSTPSPTTRVEHLPRPSPRTSIVHLLRSTPNRLLTLPHQTVITSIKPFPFSLSDPIYINTALFYHEDRTVAQTPVLVDEDYSHRTYTRDIVLGPTMNGPPPSLSLGTASSLKLSGQR